MTDESSLVRLRRRAAVRDRLDAGKVAVGASVEDVMRSSGPASVIGVGLLVLACAAERAVAEPAGLVPAEPRAEQAPRRSVEAPSPIVTTESAPSESSAVEPAKAPDPACALAATGPPGVGWIEMNLGGKQQLLDGPCANRAQRSPYVEVLDPDSGSPRVVLDACGSDGMYLDVVGHGSRLPGDVDPMRLRIADPRTGQEWLATDLRFRVTEFGTPGQAVSGTFSGTMEPRLNREASPICGRFRVPREPDRFAP